MKEKNAKIGAGSGGKIDKAPGLKYPGQGSSFKEAISKGIAIAAIALFMTGCTTIQDIANDYKDSLGNITCVNKETEQKITFDIRSVKFIGVNTVEIEGNDGTVEVITKERSSNYHCQSVIKGDFSLF